MFYIVVAGIEATQQSITIFYDIIIETNKPTSTCDCPLAASESVFLFQLPTLDGFSYGAIYHERAVVVVDTCPH